MVVVLGNRHFLCKKPRPLKSIKMVLFGLEELAKAVAKTSTPANTVRDQFERVHPCGHDPKPCGKCSHKSWACHSSRIKPALAVINYHKCNIHVYTYFRPCTVFVWTQSNSNKILSRQEQLEHAEVSTALRYLGQYYFKNKLYDEASLCAQRCCDYNDVSVPVSSELMPFLAEVVVSSSNTLTGVDGHSCL